MPESKPTMPYGKTRPTTTAWPTLRHRHIQPRPGTPESPPSQSHPPSRKPNQTCSSSHCPTTTPNTTRARRAAGIGLFRKSCGNPGVPHTDTLGRSGHRTGNPRPAGLGRSPYRPRRRALDCASRTGNPRPVGLGRSPYRPPTGRSIALRAPGDLVEAIGIEPTTSCLQSTRSPS